MSTVSLNVGGAPLASRSLGVHFTHPAGVRLQTLTSFALPDPGRASFPLDGILRGSLLLILSLLNDPGQLPGQL